MRVTRLTRSDDAALLALLSREPEVNLFGLGLAEQGVDALLWFGTHDGDALRSATLVFSGRLAVPYGPAEDMVAIGAALRGRHRPGMLVGPRAACDALWSSWAWDREKECWFDQRLMVVDSPLDAPLPRGFGLARIEEAQEIADNQAAMDREDLGFSRADVDPRGHLSAARDRIESGRTWVIRSEGRVVFQINVGISSRWGAQVGGTWVPHHARGMGVATTGMLAIRQVLMRTHPRITLHVREANTPAVRAYARAGWRWSAPYRLAVAKGMAPV
jgi:hypothetical protein